MSKHLEALIVKGRTICSSQEQNEIARALAEICTNREIHPRVCSKGGISTFIFLLTSSQDQEAQIYAAVALANCSISIEHKASIGKEALPHLIKYIKEGGCQTAKNYCAMALGNLAGEERNWEDMSSLDSVSILIRLLKSAPSDSTCGKNATMALGNIARRAESRKQIVQEGGIELLVMIACNGDTQLQQNAVFALRQICIDVEYRVMGVQHGIIDPLILMAQPSQADPVVLREVAAAFHCLSTVKENRQEISNRALATIIRLLNVGDVETEYHACGAIANLTEMVEIHAAFLTDERAGLPSIMSLIDASQDPKTKGEVLRVIANFSANTGMHHIILSTGILPTLIAALNQNDFKCQIFAALSLANFAVAVPFQIEMIKWGLITSLVALLTKVEDTPVQSKRYAALCLANLSSVEANQVMLATEDLFFGSLFCLANDPDKLSQYYVACTVANICCSEEYHQQIVREGGLQTLISLAYSPDSGVKQKAGAALRELSMSSDTAIKIVQEQGLEPLARMLDDDNSDPKVLSEAIGCIRNFSLSDENKFEVAKTGVIRLIVKYMLHEDKDVSSQSCAGLANLAQMQDIQSIVYDHENFCNCIAQVLRSPFIQVQREGGRLLAQLCTSDDTSIIEEIIENNSFKFLVSLLLSQDMICQKIAAFGLGNLSNHSAHRVELCQTGILGPLCTMVQSIKVDADTRGFCLLALANLAKSRENCGAFVEMGTIPILVSMCIDEDEKVRRNASYAVTMLASHPEMKDTVTEEGGLESILFLARTMGPSASGIVLPSITNLSRIHVNRYGICAYGGLPATVQGLETNDSTQIFLACNAIANLAEDSDNMKFIFESSSCEKLCDWIESRPDNVDLLRDGYRALGNLMAFVSYRVNLEFRDKLICVLVSDLLHKDLGVQEFAAMAVCNLSAHCKSHSMFMENAIIETSTSIIIKTLDDKSISPMEATSFLLLALSNIASSMENQNTVLAGMKDQLHKLARHRDVRCRQNAMTLIGNLCAIPENLDVLMSLGLLPVIITFAFPSQSEGTEYSRRQALFGIAGISFHQEYRNAAITNGALQPLLKVASSIDVEGSTTEHLEALRATSVALCNFTSSEEKCGQIIDAGVVPAFISLSRMDDDFCRASALDGLSSIAELNIFSQSGMIEKGLFQIILGYLEGNKLESDTRRQLLRCLTYFVFTESSQALLLRSKIWKKMEQFMSVSDDIQECRYAAMIACILASNSKNHEFLFDMNLIKEMCRRARKSLDIETLRCISLSIQLITANNDNELKCNRLLIHEIVSIMLKSSDANVLLLSAVTARLLSAFDSCHEHFIESDGAVSIFDLSRSSDVKVEREVAACLRNLACYDRPKPLLAQESRLSSILELCRSSDILVSIHSCYAIANLSEIGENRKKLFGIGALQHLMYAWVHMHSDSMEVGREVTRSMSNLSIDSSTAREMCLQGCGTVLEKALKSGELNVQILAIVAISNLAREKSVAEDIFNPVIGKLLMSKTQEYKSKSDLQEHTFACIANLTYSKTTHSLLIDENLAAVMVDTLSMDQDLDLTKTCLVVISNLAINEANHAAFHQTTVTKNLAKFLVSDDLCVLALALDALKGFAASSFIRCAIVDLRICSRLLQIAINFSSGLGADAIGLLCNLTIDGMLERENANFFEQIPINTMVSFLSNKNSQYRFFGVIACGHLAMDEKYHDRIFEHKVPPALVKAFQWSSCKETKRCIAFAVSNLLVSEENREEVISFGCIPIVVWLACSVTAESMHVGLSALRATAANTYFRKILVDSGGLRAAQLGLASIDDTCRIQAAAFILSLSNLESIQSTLIDVLASEFLAILPHGEKEFCLFILQTFAKWSENKNLHSRLVCDKRCVDKIADFASTSPEVCMLREVGRLLSNFTANDKIYMLLMEADVDRLLIKLCAKKDPMLLRFSSIGLLNLALHAHLNDKGIYNDATNSLFEAFMLTQGACGYAALAVAMLPNLNGSDDSMQQRFILDASSFIERSFEDEEKLCYAFAINRLLVNNNLHFDRRSVISILSRVVGDSHIPKGNQIMLMLYLLSSIRKLLYQGEIPLACEQGPVLTSICSLSDNSTLAGDRERSSYIFQLSLHPQETRVILGDSRIIQIIFHLCRSDDVEVARFAVATLANITAQEFTRSMVANEANQTSWVISLFKNDSYSVKIEALRTLANFLSIDEEHECLDLSDIICCIEPLSEIALYEMRYNLSICCVKINAGLSSIHVPDMTSMSSILVSISTDKNVDIRRLTSRAIHLLSMSQCHANFSFEIRFLEATISLSRDSDIEVKLYAIKSLIEISKDNSLQKDMFICGLSYAIIENYKFMKSTTVMLEIVRLTLSLSNNTANHQRMIELGMLPSILATCTHEDVRVRECISMTLCKLSASHALECSGVDALLLLICEGTFECFVACATALGNTLGKNELAEYFVKSGGLDTLIRAMKQEWAANCCILLSRIVFFVTADKKCCETLVAGGALKYFLENLKDQSCEVGSELIFMALCNLFSFDYQDFVKLAESDMKLITDLALNLVKNGLSQGIMALCNISRSFDAQLILSRIGCVSEVLKLVQSSPHLAIQEYASRVLCNFTSRKEICRKKFDGEAVAIILSTLESSKTVDLQRSMLLCLANLSTNACSHKHMINGSIMPLLQNTCTHYDTLCRRYSLIVISNLAANDAIRALVYRGKSIQALVCLLENGDRDCVLLSCYALANLSNNTIAQSLIVMHGGLLQLQACSKVNLQLVSYLAVSCLVNLSVNESNHSIFDSYGTSSILISKALEVELDEPSIPTLCCIAIANISPSFEEMTKSLVPESIFKVILLHARSANLFFKFQGLHVMRGCITSMERTQLDLQLDQLCRLFVECSYLQDHEIIKEDMTYISILSERFRGNEVDIAEQCISRLFYVLHGPFGSLCNQNGFMALANLAEDMGVHYEITKHLRQGFLIQSLQEGTLEVQREVVRFICNLQSSNFFPPDDNLLRLLLELIRVNELCLTDSAYKKSLALFLRKLASDHMYHPFIFPSSFKSLSLLIEVTEITIKLNAAETFRELCGNSNFSAEIGERGGINCAMSLVKMPQDECRKIGFTALMHLSRVTSLCNAIASAGAIEISTSCMKKSSKITQSDILELCANLSEVVEVRSTMLQLGVHIALIAAMQQKDMQKDLSMEENAVRTVANICSTTEHQLSIYMGGGLEFIMSRMYTENLVSRCYIAAGFVFMISNPNVRGNMSNTDVILEYSQALATCDRSEYERSAAEAIKILTLDGDDLQDQYHRLDIETALNLCQHVHPSVRYNACSSIANLAMTGAFGASILSCNGVKVMYKLGKFESSDESVIREVTRFFSMLSCDDRFQIEMMRCDVDSFLLAMVHSKDRQTRHFAGLSVCNLFFTQYDATLLTRGAIESIATLTNCADIPVQRFAALAIAAISLGATFEVKRRVLDRKIIMPLVTMLTIPDKELNRFGLLSLNCITLDCVRDEDISLLMSQKILEYGFLTPVLQLISLSNSFSLNELEIIHDCCYLLGTLSEHGLLQEKLVELNSIELIVSKLNDISKKGIAALEIRQAVAYYLASLSQKQSHHEGMERAQAFEACVLVANTYDQECQDFASFALAQILGGNNPDYQIKLAQVGAVQTCVSLMSSEQRGLARHYAARTLLKLSENIQNHKIINESGGIQALLQLSKTKTRVGTDTEEDTNCKADALLAVGKLANAAIIKRPKPY